MSSCLYAAEKAVSRSGVQVQRETISELVRIGAPSMLSNLILYAGFYLINNEVQKYGADVLNGQGIATTFRRSALSCLRHSPPR
jgi:Na+-driven multidrug efflux pump